MKAIKFYVLQALSWFHHLFAETPQPQQVNEATSKTMPYGDNPSLGRVLLYKTGKGIQNLGDSIQGASEKLQIKLVKMERYERIYRRKAEVVQQNGYSQSIY